MNKISKFFSKIKEPMVFDWDKAARLIKKRNAKFAYAGLEEDWVDTSGVIWDSSKGGIVRNKKLFLASTWTKPIIEVNWSKYRCYRRKSKTPGWDELTVWPDSAMAIVEG